ncbi:hypothetical protein TNCV_224351 [Trichonephila clavipes]|nr:hypothetical protein TNCV_224351 [Trichonephila clavipes]
MSGNDGGRVVGLTPDTVCRPWRSFQRRNVMRFRCLQKRPLTPITLVEEAYFAAVVTYLSLQSKDELNA